MVSSFLKQFKKFILRKSWHAGEVTPFRIQSCDFWQIHTSQIHDKYLWSSLQQHTEQLKPPLCPLVVNPSPAPSSQQPLICVLPLWLLACPRMSWKWIYTMCSLWAWLLSLSFMNLRFILLVACINVLFFLLPNSIPVQGYTTVCLFIPMLFPVWVN